MQRKIVLIGLLSAFSFVEAAESPSAASIPGYEIVRKFVMVPPNGSVDLVARCPAGKDITGAGYIVASNKLQVTYSGLSGTNEWTVQAINPAPVELGLWSQLFCAGSGAAPAPISTPVWRKQHTESYKEWKVGDTRMYPMICPAKMKAVSGGATSDNPNVVVQATQIKLDRPGPPYMVESHKIYITVRRVPSVAEIEAIAKGTSPAAVAANVTYWSICLD
jgi:hypothetical protein